MSIHDEGEYGDIPCAAAVEEWLEWHENPDYDCPVPRAPDGLARWVARGGRITAAHIGTIQDHAASMDRWVESLRRERDKCIAEADKARSDADKARGEAHAANIAAQSVHEAAALRAFADTVRAMADRIEAGPAGEVVP